MLGIWHGGDWLKERFGSTQSMVGWFVEVSYLANLCNHEYCLFLLGILWANILVYMVIICFIFILVICWLLYALKKITFWLVSMSYLVGKNTGGEVGGGESIF